MTTEVVTYEALPLAERMSYANTVSVAAAMLPSGIRGATPDVTAANAFLIMETGAMLDLHPIAALSSVNIIEGKPALSADLMVSVVRNAGHTVRISEEGTIEGGDYKATVTVIRGDDPDYPVTSVWTPQRAARAGLCQYAIDSSTGQWAVSATSQKGHPLPWQQYTEALCKARAKSEACRDGAGDSLNGARYTPEELGAQVDAAGDPIITTLGAEEAAEEPKPSAMPPATKRATVGKQGKRRTSAAKAAEAAHEAKPADDIVDAEVVEEPAPKQDAEDAAEAQLAADGHVDAAVLDAVAEERAERERMAAEQTRLVTEREAILKTAEQVDRADEAAVKAWNAEHGKATGHYLTSDAELERQRAKAEPAPEVEQPAEPQPEAPMFVDKATGDVYESQQQLDDAVRARLQAEINADMAEQVTVEIAAAPARENYDEVTAAEPKNYLRRIAAAVTVDQTKHVWVDAQSDTENPMTTDLRVAIVNRKSEIEAQG